MSDFIAIRSAGLKMLEAFFPAMGRRYENGRNYDHGSGHHSAVSVLSPYIRRRVLTEAEVVAAALAAHGPHDARVFVEEVIWRGYFKGWLERRPQVWDSYVEGLNADLVSLKCDRRLRLEVSPAQFIAHDPHDLADRTVAGSAKQIFTPFVTRGPLRDWLTRAEPFLAHHSITLCEQRRIWDDAIWPHATAGFFKVRKQIPRILEETGLV